MPGPPDPTVWQTKVSIGVRPKYNASLVSAGVWDVWKGPEGKVFTVAILTTTPNNLTRQVRDRMPDILRPEAASAWLDPRVHDPGTVMSLVGPYPANPALDRSFEGPDCLVPSPA